VERYGEINRNVLNLAAERNQMGLGALCVIKINMENVARFPAKACFDLIRKCLPKSPTTSHKQPENAGFTVVQSQ
jgi:hypothetical protein